MLRFAPSPTADMSIGDLRVALFNYIYSKQVNEQLTIRVEDTNKAENIEGKDAEFLGLLELFGIKYETVSYQSEGFKRHQLMALQLLNTQRAFNCFCTNKTLDAKQKAARKDKKTYRYDGTCENLTMAESGDNENPFSVRIKKPITAIEFTDKVKGDKHFEPEDIDSFIILDQNKMPSNIFAGAVDDMISDVSLVIRSEDHILNTPKQMAVRAALGYTKSIEYAHLPGILNNSGEKMSFKDDSFSVKHLLEEGFIPEAIINYLVLLGNDVPKEIFTLDEAVEFFDIAKVSTEAAKFDMEKLRFINCEHLNLMDDVELSRYVGFADADLGKAAKIYLEEVSTTKELKEKMAAIFSEKSEDNESVKQLKALLKQAPHFESFEKLQDYIIKESDIKDENLLKSIRNVLTGAEHGPDLETLYPLIKNYLAEIIR